MSFDREPMKAKAAELAAQGVFLGTNAEARQAGRALIGEGTKSPKRKTLNFVNTRVVGSFGGQPCFA